ncbi:uncharacterized mitochondrial protein AtMg00810-like [Lathyrus oleraceus]|uniref:uncharacterized mitochondrial protein AtMg00810-like n=1 Tax=Pisum sativum TaxID=3888 RepID=UPI0021CE2DFC|nr:uncharacterized mitochondrial protein AtMg00810-like [Pisum sativum]
MDIELQALAENQTWEVVELPPGKVPIGCRWVYKIKYKADGSIERYKARLGWRMEQLDDNNAFLHGDLHEEVYMTLPPGLTSAVPSQADHSLYVKSTKDTFTSILVYVDDIVLTKNSLHEIHHVKHILDDKFRIKDLGQLRFFLGFEIARSSKGIFMNQRKYTLELLEDTGFLAAKPSSIPFDPNLKLSPTDGELLPDPTSYRRLIGRLIYLTNTRPDISFAVQHLSQFVSKPLVPHYQAATKILRFLKSSPAKGIFLSASSPLKLCAFADSDWARCPTTRKSITGFCVVLGNSLLCWKSKKQNTVSRSSTEAEYRALASLTCEIQWLQFLFNDLMVQLSQPASVYCDRKSAIYLAHNPTFHERSKYIELDCHVIREKIVSRLIHLLPVSTNDQLADVFTKPLHSPAFSSILSKWQA